MKVYVCTVLFALCIVVISAWPTLEGKEDKPLDCPVNEQYYKCSLEQCFTKCEHLTNYPACPQLSPDCYEPACLCVTDFLRNKDGVCIPSSQCPR